MTSEPTRPTAMTDELAALAPKWREVTRDVLFGDIWERPELSKRDRSLITCAALIALYRGNELRSHLGRALDNGVTQEEIIEMITHLAFYAGWPCSASALHAAADAFGA